MANPSRTYAAWAAMKHRCDNPNAQNAKYYNNLDIGYAAAWKDFPAFLRDMGECPEGFCLDRKDNNGHYSKENCRWATPAESGRNRSTTLLTHRQVILIRGLLQALRPGRTPWGAYTQIGNLFGVSRKVIEAIARGRSWKGVS